MKITHLIIIIVIASCVMIASKAYAGPETHCYSYRDANGLAYCLRALQQRGAVRTSGMMDPATAKIYNIVTTQRVAPTTRIPQVGYQYVPYGTPVVYYPSGGQQNPISVIGNVAGSMLGAAAWAYNWRHGWVGSRGVLGASYMMNYPW